jgi:hypothetical protein
VREDDGRDPGRVDEVALAEADEDLRVVPGGRLEPGLELPGDGEVEGPRSIC